MDTKDIFAGGRKPTFIAAASLRKHQTQAEKILWDYLSKKPFGIKFRRQHVYAIWVLDFIAMRSNLLSKLMAQYMM